MGRSGTMRTAWQAPSTHCECPHAASRQTELRLPHYSERAQRNRVSMSLPSPRVQLASLDTPGEPVLAANARLASTARVRSTAVPADCKEAIDESQRSRRAALTAEDQRRGAVSTRNDAAAHIADVDVSAATCDGSDGVQPEQSCVGQPQHHALKRRRRAAVWKNVSTRRAGAGCRVKGAGCRVQGAGCRVQGAGCRVQGAGCRVQGAGCRV
jgi:hypothetical protein